MWLFVSLLHARACGAATARGQVGFAGVGVFRDRVLLEAGAPHAGLLGAVLEGRSRTRGSFVCTLIASHPHSSVVDE